jgi:hypothetical protein
MGRKKAAEQIVQQTADGMQMPQEQAPPASGSQPPAREPGDDSHLEQAAADGGQKQARKQSYTGKLKVLEDGTVAHYRDYGNRDGVKVHFEFPKEDEKPTPEVTEPLKEHHEDRNRFAYGKPTPKRWNKRVSNNPIAERLDAEERFETAVERLQESRKKDKGQEPTPF